MLRGTSDPRRRRYSRGASESGDSEARLSRSRPQSRSSDVFQDAEDVSEMEYARTASRQERRRSVTGRDSELEKRRSMRRDSASIIPSDIARPNSRAASSLAHYASANEDARPHSRSASRLGRSSSRLGRSSSQIRDRERALADDMVGITPAADPGEKRERTRKKKSDALASDEKRRTHRRTVPSASSTGRATHEERRAARKAAAGSDAGKTHRKRRPREERSAASPSVADTKTRAPRENRRSRERGDMRRVKSETFFDAPGDVKPTHAPKRLSADLGRPGRTSLERSGSHRAADPIERIAAPPSEAGFPSKRTSAPPAAKSPPMSIAGSSRRFLGSVPLLGRSRAPTIRSFRPGNDEERMRAAQEKADARVRAIQERAEAKQRAAEEKLETRRLANETRAEAKERVARAKAEAKEAAAQRKAAAKELAMTERQRKQDARERKAAEKRDAKLDAQRQREIQKTEALAAVREQERQRELAEMDRKQKRLMAITPFRRREDADEVLLTPEQRHGLLKSLVMMQMQQEFLDFGHPGILAQYGYPFTSEGMSVQRSRRRELAFWSKKKDATAHMPQGALDALHEPLLLRHMFHVHLRHFPGLANAPLAFYRKRIQRLSDAFTADAMSTSRERSELVLSHMLSLVGTQYLGLFFARGFGVRGPDELRGPGIGEPGTEAWGAGKEWGAGTVKRGLDRPYQLTDADYRLIDSLFYSEELDAWVAAGRESQRVQDDFSAFKETIIEQETGLEEIIEYLAVSNVNNLPPHLQNAEEWVRIHIALMMRWLFVDSPSADSLFNFVRVVHMLFPYWPARQILKIANAQVMIQMMLSLLLAQPAGTKSLFQRIVGFVVSRGISSIQREYIDPLRKEISEPVLVQKIEAYVRHKTAHETERLERLADESGNDLLTTILLSDREPRLESGMRAHVLDLQRAYAASPYRANPDLAYPRTTPRGKDTPPIPGWGVSVGDASKARMFALLKLLLREQLNKRDREKFASLLSSSLVVNTIKDGLQIVFYDAIRDIASVADLSGRLGDLQKLIEDMIQVRKTTDNSAERWIDLANKHHEFIYFFVHECAPVAKPLWEWCQMGCDYMSLSTTDPAHPADRSAENIEVNLDEMLQDERLSASDVDHIVREMDALTTWSRWRKIRRELEFRKNFLLAVQPGPTGLWRESLPSDSMREAVEDVDGLFLELLEKERVAPDDGACDAVRGGERQHVPWAFFDVRDPLGQGLRAEPPSEEHRIEKPRVDVRPPTLDYTRRLLPMFRELLISKLPDWLDPEVNGEPIPQPKSLVATSTQLLKPKGLLRRG
ncbi:hypothetical protein CBS9595_001828 [Malassezia furfur]|nr:hypothetical protein CBS9595_001828 [Malassezia furfur]